MAQFDDLPIIIKEKIFTFLNESQDKQNFSLVNKISDKIFKKYADLNSSLLKYQDNYRLKHDRYAIDANVIANSASDNELEVIKAVKLILNVYESNLLTIVNLLESHFEDFSHKNNSDDKSAINTNGFLFKKQILSEIIQVLRLKLDRYEVTFQYKNTTINRLINSILYYLNEFRKIKSYKEGMKKSRILNIEKNVELIHFRAMNELIIRNLMTANEEGFKNNTLNTGNLTVKQYTLNKQPLFFNQSSPLKQEYSFFHFSSIFLAFSSYCNWWCAKCNVGIIFFITRRK